MSGSLLDEFGEPTGGIYCPWLRPLRWDAVFVEDRLWSADKNDFEDPNEFLSVEVRASRRQGHSADSEFRGGEGDIPEGNSVVSHICLRDDIAYGDNLQRYDAARTVGLYRHLANCPDTVEAARDFIAQHGFIHQARSTRYPFSVFGMVREEIERGAEFLEARKYMDLAELLRNNVDFIVLRPVLNVRYRFALRSQLSSTERFSSEPGKDDEPALAYSTGPPDLSVVAGSLEALMFYQLAQDAATLSGDVLMKVCPQCNAFFKAGPGTVPFRRADSVFCSQQCNNRAKYARRKGCAS